MINLASEDKKAMSGGLRYIIPTSGYKPFEYHAADPSGHILYTDDRIEKYENADWVILSESEFIKVAIAYDDSLCDHWKEVTEETYLDMLGCLPPLRWENGGFFISEMYTSNISNFYQKWNGKFYMSLQRLSTPRTEILGSLKKYVEEQNEV